MTSSVSQRNMMDFSWLREQTSASNASGRGARRISSTRLWCSSLGIVTFFALLSSPAICIPAKATRSRLMGTNRMPFFGSRARCAPSDRGKANISPMGQRDRWEAGLLSLAHFKQAHGHCDVPKRLASDPRLANWCSMQRQKMKRGLLSEYKIRALQDLSFSSCQRPRWEILFSDLCRYKQNTGHCDVPRLRGAQCSTLGRWLMTQRKRHQQHVALRTMQSESTNNETMLAAYVERCRRLDALGVNWIAHQSWQYAFASLLSFRMHWGHVRVPRKRQKGQFVVAGIDERTLSRWIDRQRWRMRVGKLVKARLRMLEEAGICMDKTVNEASARRATKVAARSDADDDDDDQDEEEGEDDDDDDDYEDYVDDDDDDVPAVR